jgi:hypothetical protein
MRYGFELGTVAAVVVILGVGPAPSAQTSTQTPTQSLIDKRIAEAEAAGAKHPKVNLIRLDPPENVYAPGKWMMIMTAGSNWGCFVLDRPVK